MGKIRFAPIVRVSTERQEKKGESLETQKKQIVRAVESLDGKIPNRCWDYSGQESASGILERKKLDQLLKDTSKNIFDAVIVADASRWSRDNQKSKTGLEILRSNGIRFFVNASEVDLYSPEQTFFIGMSVEVGEFQAKMQTQKSTLNRIERAKRGIPSGGKLPFGRTYDKKTGLWGIDKKKKESILWAAEQYLKGESLPNISKKLGRNNSSLTKILRERCGEKWELKFKVERFNIDETVTIKIPRLLPEETIDKIRKQLKANQTFMHGQLKNKYLLGRMIFCGKCGYSLFGQVNHSKKKYYRHSRHGGNSCRNFHSIPANIIDEAILVEVFSVFGDEPKLKKAINDAYPDTKKVEKLGKRLVAIDKELKKIETAINRIIVLVEKGLLNDSEVKKRMDALREQKTLLSDEEIEINAAIYSMPSEKDLDKRAKILQKMIVGQYHSPAHLASMSFDEKRMLLQTIFSGTDEKGKRAGVYVQKKDDKWFYEIKGVFASNFKDGLGNLPMSLEVRQAMFGVHEDAESTYDPLTDGDKLDIHSKCHAYHSFGIY